MAVRASSAGRLRPGGLAALRSTLDVRFWLVAALATGGSLLVLGVPTAVIPNPLFIRMTPTETFIVVVWLASAPLIGLLIATYVRPPRHPIGHDRGEHGAGRTTLGGIAAYLAIGCPICNKVVVAALGVSAALSISPAPAAYRCGLRSFPWGDIGLAAPRSRTTLRALRRLTESAS